jgi:hypothetical protein
MPTRIDSIIGDIDNVYSDSREWIKHIPKVSTREAWDKYHEKQYLAKPNKRMIRRIVEISKYIPILFVTSREDRHDMKKKTIEEIEKFSDNMIKIGPLHKIYMRKDGDYDPSDVVKEDILLNKILPKGFNPIIAIDDEPANIEMYERHNIATKLYDINKVK